MPPSLHKLEAGEFSDWEEDPFGLQSRLEDKRSAVVCDRMDDWLLAFMDDVADPLRSHLSGRRPWRPVRKKYLHQAT